MTDPLGEDIRRRQLNGMRLFGRSEASIHHRHRDQTEALRRKLQPAEREHLDFVIANAELPSDLQSPLHHAHMVSWFHRAKTTLQGEKKGVADPVLASVYGTDVNGSALCYGPDRYAIIMGEALFDLFHALPVLLLNGVHGKPDEPAFVDDKDVILRRMRSNQSLQRYFDELVLSYLLDGSLSRITYRPVPENPAMLALVGFIGNGIGLFTMGHEYGHIVDGHLDGAGPGRVLLSDELAGIDGPSGLPNFIGRHALEFRADSLGIQACTRGHELYFVVQQYLFGALAYLYFQTVLEHALALWVRGKETYRSDFERLFDTFTLSITPHPCSNLRALKLLEDLKSPGAQMPWLEDDVQLIDFMVKTLFDEYWRAFVDRVTQADIDKHPLSRLWTVRARRLAGRKPVRRECWSLDELAEFLMAEATAHGSNQPLW